MSVQTKFDEINCVARQLIANRMRMRLSSRRQDVGSIVYRSPLALNRALLLDIQPHTIALLPFSIQIQLRRPGVCNAWDLNLNQIKSNVSRSQRSLRYS